MQVSPIFPDSSDFARAFYSEAARHLADGRVLLRGRRHVGAVTSSMKAAELGIKSALLLENAWPFFDKLFRTHKPLTETERHPLLGRLARNLEGNRANLSIEIKALESLEPLPFGFEDYSVGAALNSEYPFLIKDADPSGNAVVRLEAPETRLTPAEALGHYRLAQELLTCLPILYTGMGAWRIRLRALALQWCATPWLGSSITRSQTIGITTPLTRDRY